MALITGAPSVVLVEDDLQRDTSAKHTIGFRAKSETAEYIYVTAGGAITTSGDPVSAAGALSAVVRGDLDVGVFVGVANAPMASGESGFIQTKGVASVVVESGAAAGVGIQLSGTVGKFKAITSSGDQVGVMLEASDDASAARKSVLLL